MFKQFLVDAGGIYGGIRFFDEDGEVYFTALNLLAAFVTQLKFFLGERLWQAERKLHKFTVKRFDFNSIFCNARIETRGAIACHRFYHTQRYGFQTTNPVRALLP